MSAQPRWREPPCSESAGAARDQTGAADSPTPTGAQAAPGLLPCWPFAAPASTEGSEGFLACVSPGTFRGVCKKIDHFPEDADYEQDTAEYLLREFAFLRRGRAPWGPLLPWHPLLVPQYPEQIPPSCWQEADGWQPPGPCTAAVTLGVTRVWPHHAAVTVLMAHLSGTGCPCSRSQQLLSLSGRDGCRGQDPPSPRCSTARVPCLCQSRCTQDPAAGLDSLVLTGRAR